MRPNLHCRLSNALAILLVSACAAAGAATDEDEAKPANKLTLGAYRFSDSGHAGDINLRHTNDFGDTWIGYYHAAHREEHQGRLGWDNTFEWSALRLTPSVQIASRGYLNGSVNLETGERWFVGLGFGRTNLKPNWNLNFDPNDAWSVSAGFRGEGESLAFTFVRDDRENPDERHLHAVYRKSLPDHQRLTLDVLHKRGLVDGESIRKTGLTLTYDWPRYFVRLAFDPKVNFTREDMTRVSIGTRF